MKIRIIISVLLAVILFGCGRQPELVNVPVPAEEIPVTTDFAVQTITPTAGVDEVTQPTPAPEIKPPATTTETQIPSQLELPVLFAQQAPFANWDEVHEETCEEASMIMADKYFKQQDLNESIMEEEIQKIINWQAERGYQVDLTAEETAKILADYYGLSARLVKDASVNRIKYEIAKGNLVIIPAAGRLLHNPNFKQPGPIYHMLVVKGYNSREFITNDPGTRKGNGYKYPYGILTDAIHNWNHERAENGMTDEEIVQGEKVLVIVDGLTK